ncbi:short-chain dehydrogenase [Enterococcus florum]|uniref:Short-chain dehydrogenase n=1 Tax=Enterococcus florum TaxID=2480627 RepID=A0A4P5PLI1_9ENTE|nr:SDR family oxidoreductase [Enterococcus florum]GCF94133.1 short-chain dehydrogenase [Enterococcus florum]
MTEAALITGCTSGIGEAFTHLLAREYTSLILVARNEIQLTQQAQNLSEVYGIAVYPIVADLEVAGAAAAIAQKTKESRLTVTTLINNAGFNVCGAFLNTDWQKEQAMLQLHAVFPTEMMKLFLPDMAKLKAGRILNVGSTGSYLPTPNDAVYAATKSYLLSVSKAIAAELQGSGVTITTLCPGATKTNFAKKAGIEDTWLFKLFVMDPNTVAAIGYRAMRRGKSAVTAGIYNKLLVSCSCLLPNPLLYYISKKML